MKHLRLTGSESASESAPSFFICSTRKMSSAVACFKYAINTKQLYWKTKDFLWEILKF